MNDYYYISDIHVDTNTPLLWDNIPDQCEFFTALIKDMLASIGGDSYDKTLLIAGDTSSSAVETSRFYSLLSSYWNGRIVAVLGNHELWHDDPSELARTFSINEVYDDYKEKCGEFATILENELLLASPDGDERILSRDEIMRADDDELHHFVVSSEMAVLGGTGFSAKNDRFNAAGGMYMDKVNIQQEVYRTKLWCEVYEKMGRSCGDVPLIVLTHMPVSDWSYEFPNANWRYVNGHTHENKRERMNGKIIVYSDNQVGMAWRSIKLKKFRF